MKSKTVLAPSKGLEDFAAQNRSYRKQSRRFGCQWPAENHDLVGLTIGRSRVPGTAGGRGTNAYALIGRFAKVFAVTR